MPARGVGLMSTSAFRVVVVVVVVVEKENVAWVTPQHPNKNMNDEKLLSIETNVNDGTNANDTDTILILVRYSKEAEDDPYGPSKTGTATCWENWFEMEGSQWGRQGSKRTINNNHSAGDKNLCVKTTPSPPSSRHQGQSSTD
jgi:hypothetical protein